MAGKGGREEGRKSAEAVALTCVCVCVRACPCQEDSAFLSYQLLEGVCEDSRKV